MTLINKIAVNFSLLNARNFLEKQTTKHFHQNVGTSLVYGSEFRILFYIHKTVKPPCFSSFESYNMYVLLI